MKKVLLTGASGFIGRHCIPFLLEKGYRVYAVDSGNYESVIENKNLFRLTLNLHNERRTEEILAEIKPTHLLHLAWYTEHGLFWNSDRNIEWVISSLRLFTGFLNNGGKRVVVAGTCAEYDWQYGVCNEKLTPLKPSTLYGVSKNSLNNILYRYALLHDVSYAWGRIFFLYGPYEIEKRIIPYVITSLLKNEPARCTEGQQIRDFLHVEDVANAFVSLLDSNLNGSVNIASGMPVSIKQIAEKLGSIINKPDLVQLGARSDSPDEPPVILADVNRLKFELDWHPKYDLDQGLQSTVAWWKDKLIEKERIGT